MREALDYGLTGAYLDDRITRDVTRLIRAGYSVEQINQVHRWMEMYPGEVAAVLAKIEQD